MHFFSLERYKVEFICHSRIYPSFSFFPGVSVLVLHADKIKITAILIGGHSDLK